MLPTERSYTISAIDRVLNQVDIRTTTDDISLSKTSTLPQTLQVKVNAPVIITTNHPKRKYKEDGICNGQKGYIDFIEVSKEDPEQVEIIWVVFTNKDVGKFYRFEHVSAIF